MADELDRLVTAGLVEAGGLAASRGGRRSPIVQIARHLHFVGIDIGATSVDVAVTDGELRVLGHLAEPADVRDGPERVLDLALEAIGNHGFIPATWPGPGSAGGAMSTNDRERFKTELEFASILGMPFMGTGNDPTSANDRNIEAWDLAGEKWEALNDLVRDWCIKIYPHNHSPAYNFLQDGPMVEVTEDRVTGAPIAATLVRGESGKRLMQHYLDVTDPRRCFVEMDIYWAHVAQHQWRWRYDWEGNRVEDIFDPTRQVARQTKRYALFHAKDGDRTTEPPGVGNGYGIIPFDDPRSDIDFEHFYKRIGARGYHNSNYEQDNAPGGAADPGQSLRHTKISAQNMHTLRG